MILQYIYLIFILNFNLVLCYNKYSQEANLNKEKINFRELEKPFRMAKLNMLWSKAQLRLTESKLKSLFSELKIHDKEELIFKKLKSEGNDKEGLKEAEIRKKLIGIMSTYDLLEHFKDIHDPKQNNNHKSLYGQQSDHYHKSVFRDKKLNKLWDKAEKSGFTAEELKALREEFQHHQDKIDTYQSIIKEESDPNDTHESNFDSIDVNLEQFNEIEEIPNKNKINAKANLLREKYLEIRDGYDNLQRRTHKGPNNKEFIEPKVQGLWKIAIESNFSTEELESIRVELLHYENRLLKLRDLHAEIAFREQSKSNEPKENAMLHDNMKKITRKIEKLHLTLESKIMMKHGEL